MAPSRRKTALITGCTPGGIGAALCVAFQRRGFHVFATVRDPTKAALLATSTQDGRIEVLPLDVTSRDSIQKSAEMLKTREELAQGLDVLVNNAGGMLIGPLLDLDLEAARKVFDVNVWGMLAVTQAFAPQVVAARGAIMNVCSIAGAVQMAWQGVYNASKAAETFLSETLRIEMEPLGVRVVTAMVGEVQTQIYQSSSSYTLPEGSYYKSVESYISDQGAGKFQQNNESANRVAQNLVSDVLSGSSGQTWRGGVAGTAKIAHWLLPGRLFEWMLHSSRGISQLRTAYSKSQGQKGRS